MVSEAQTTPSSDSGNILIRYYKEEDEEAVKKLFASGIMMNTNAAFMKMIGNPLILGVFGSVIALTAKISRSIVAVLLVGLLALGLVHRFTKQIFADYVKGSLQADLSNINKVYAASGGHFLVAADVTSGSIIGIIGGEGKGKNVFELRRMSADPAYHGKGVGKMLLQRLEKECQAEKMSLTTTSIMYAAHSLYRRNGFALTRKFQAYTGSMRHFCNIEIYEFVKEYRPQQK